jgi:5'-deoxynucleotidase YfbR-like HD superfamily hydrolase
MTQLALDEIKKQEESRMNSMIDERLKDKDEEIQALKTSFKSYDEEMNDMGNVMKKLDSSMQFYRNEFKLFREQYGGRHLTMGERKRIEEFREEMEGMPDTDREDAD